MDYKEFAKRIKNKYPEYNDLEDLDLAKRVVKKYPEYSDVTFPETSTEKQETQIQESLEKPVQESVEEPVQEDKKFSFKGFAEQIKKPPQKGDTLKTLLNLASFAPTPAGLAAKAAAIGSKVPIISKGTGYLAKKAAETLPQAALGAGATYIGERQKGAYEDEALKAGAKGALLETAVGAGIEAVGASTKGLGKIITKNIPDDLYQKAKKFNEDTAVSVGKRIEQITNLGKKALKNNEIIAKKANKKALSASNKNKIIAKSLADNMLDLGKEFNKKNTPEGKISLINNISESDLSSAIQAQYNKLKLRAEPLKENGGISRNIEAEKLFKDFKNRFMTTKQVQKERIIPDPSGYGLERKEKYTEEIVRPIKDREKFFTEMRLITDDSTWGEGKSAIKQAYARVYDSLNNFLKKNSAKYEEHKNLGQDLVNFSDYKVDIVDEYDPNKLQNALKESLSTFEKQPDITSSKIIERVLDQANQRLNKKYKIKDFIKKFDQNEQYKLLKNEGNLSDSQLNLLDKNSRKIYADNRDLGKVTDEGFFKPKQDVNQFVEGQEGTGLKGTRLAKLLDPKLVEQLEIEQAKRYFEQPIGLNLPIGGIAKPSGRVLQEIMNAIKIPKIQFGTKKFLEGDLPITPEKLGIGARTLGRAAARKTVRSDEQKVDVILDERSNQARFITRKSYPKKPYATEYQRNQRGEYIDQEKIKKDRGIIK